MNSRSHCPQCGTQLATNNQFGNHVGPSVCVCGWVDNVLSSKEELAIQNRTNMILVISAIALAALFFHVATWGSHSFSVPFLKAQKLVGVISTQGYQELAKSCMLVRKYECVKEAYASLYNDKKEVEALHALAKLQSRMGEHSAAEKTYENYFKLGGKSAVAAVDMGLVLETRGNTDHAVKYYKMAVAQAGETLPTQATQGIVRILMLKGKYNEAYARIVMFHESAENARGYMNKELEALKAIRGTPTAGAEQELKREIRRIRQTERTPASS